MVRARRKLLVELLREAADAIGYELAAAGYDPESDEDWGPTYPANARLLARIEWVVAAEREPR